MKKVENVDLDVLVAPNQKLPNSEMMDLWNLRSDILFYGVSIEGDDYVSLLFFSPVDALLHLLNPIFIRDAISLATPENPANSKSSAMFRFNTPFRLREYRLDVSAKYFDARNKSRPSCSDIGSSNFKIDFNLILPLGTLLVGTNRVPPKDMQVDEILSNIINNSVSNKSEIQAIKTEAFYFCSPGKTLRIEKSFIVNMSLLWTFYSALLKKGYDPNTMRNKVFLDPTNGQKLIGGFINSTFVPSTIGDLPKDIADAIQKGEPLDNLLNRCSVNNLTQRICISGLLFKNLWERDVPSINEYFKYDKYIITEVKNSAVRGWLFKEDYNQNMGRDIIAYNWNYNRFLDVNTVIKWMRLKIASIKTPENKTIYRFNPEQINRFKKINIYNADYTVKVELSFNGEEFWIFTSPVAENVGLKAKPRSAEIVKEIQMMIYDLFQSSLVKFNLRKGFGEHYQIITLDKNDNFFLLVLVSSLLRFLLKQEEFVFFNFE